ncbi:hypothetical protein BS78_04G069600 [Paspalum vaginatum]|nr:hypothetical protein BS78_04G069600 [Paspalum vaginatum]
MLRLGNHFIPLLRAASPLLSPIRHRACLLLSTSPAPFSLEDYLVAACGLAPDQARETSKKAFEEASKNARKPFEELSHCRLNNASNPDAVLALLSSVGLSRAEIAAVVAADPLILRAYAKNIGPRLLAIRDRLDLSTPQIYRFLLAASRALRSGDVWPNLQFLLSFFGSFEQVLVATKKFYRILLVDLDRVFKPNITQFLQCGLSVGDIVQLCSHYPSLFVFSSERVKEFVLRADALGVHRNSGTFKYAMGIAACVSKEKVAARIEFLKSTLGCSESEIAIAVSKMPTLVGLSEERLLTKIRFLLNEVGLEPWYIVENPSLLGFSLEKRLVPRHCVMKLLQAKGLLNSNQSFHSFASMSEKTFRLKFIDSHKDSVPGLADAYAAASACGVHPESPTLTS